MLSKHMFKLFRIALSFIADDSAGEIQLTAFSDTIAKLLGKTIDEIYKPNNDVRQYCPNSF